MMLALCMTAAKWCHSPSWVSSGQQKRTVLSPTTAWPPLSPPSAAATTTTTTTTGNNGINHNTIDITALHGPLVTGKYIQHFFSTGVNDTLNKFLWSTAHNISPVGIYRHLYSHTEPHWTLNTSHFMQFWTVLVWILRGKHTEKKWLPQPM